MDGQQSVPKEEGEKEGESVPNGEGEEEGEDRVRKTKLTKNRIIFKNIIITT